MGKDTLSALTRGIHHAASSTAAMLGQQYMQMLAQYFDERGGRLYAKLAYLQLSEQHTVAVPLIALVAPKGLALERMKVSLSVRIDDTELKQATVDGDEYDGDRVSMKVTVSPRTRDGERRATDVTDIEMEFAAGEPPEAIMRIIDAYANLVDPKKFDGGLADLMARYPPTPLTYGADTTGSAAQAGPPAGAT